MGGEETGKTKKKIKKLNNEELAVFCEQLGMMLDAAIMPADGVWIMLKDAEIEDSMDLKIILTSLVNELHAGKRLHALPGLPLQQGTYHFRYRQGFPEGTSYNDSGHVFCSSDTGSEGTAHI